MPRLDQTVGAQRWRLAALDDRADNVWRQEGEIHEVSDAALGDALAVMGGSEVGRYTFRWFLKNEVGEG